jgi:hypothetical protein
MKKTARRIPRFGAQPLGRLFGAVGMKNPVGPVATVFPEFIARDGQERADGPLRRQTQGWHGPQAQPRTRPCAP